MSCPRVTLGCYAFVGGGHMEYKTLNNGVKMPALGFGICGFSDLLECKNIILEAIKHGVRMFDTAAIYQNEELRNGY